jgi:hypothetical protein
MLYFLDKIVLWYCLHLFKTYNYMCFSFLLFWKKNKYYAFIKI